MQTILPWVAVEQTAFANAPRETAINLPVLAWDVASVTYRTTRTLKIIFGQKKKKKNRTLQGFWSKNKKSYYSDKKEQQNCKVFVI